MHFQWGRNPKFASSPWECVTPPKEDRATAIGNMHKKFGIGKDRACGSRDMLSDRHTDTHTDMLITILRYSCCGRSNKNFVEFEHVVIEICEQTEIQTRRSHYFILLPGEIIIVRRDRHTRETQCITRATKVVSNIYKIGQYLLKLKMLGIVLLPREILWSACMHVCLFVCLFVPVRILEITSPNFIKFSMHITCVRGSVFLWRQCNRLCTSGFVDDVMFSYSARNRPESKTTRMFRSVRQVAATGAKYLRPNLVVLTHFVQISKMGTVHAKLANRPFLVCDFRALWRSGLSARVPESQKLKMVG